MEFEEFSELLNEPEANDDGASKAFLLFCFNVLFDGDDDSSGAAMAAMMANSFCKSPTNYVKSMRIVNKSLRIRHDSKPKPAASHSFKM
jgi:hypothetical protein